MSYFTLFSLANIMLIGLLSSYTDLSRGKIYNNFVGPGFILGFLILALFYGKGYNGPYLGAVLLNGAIAFIFSYLLWFLKKWSAGDAKLYSFFAFFLPFCFYRNSYVGLFPSINILLNSFIIIVVFIALNSLIFIAGKVFAGYRPFSSKGIEFRGVFVFVKIMASYVPIMYFISLLSRIPLLAPAFANNMAVFFAMFFLYGPVSKNQKIRDALSILSLFVLAYLLVLDRAVFIGLIYKTVIFVGMIGALSRFFDFYIKTNETAGVKVKDLRPGQILVESECARIAGFACQKDEDNGYNDTKSYGLNPSQIKIIRSLYMDEDSFRVYKTFPLGPLMFIGVLITVLTSNSLIKMIMERLKAF